jgi:hypothetical protein
MSELGRYVAKNCDIVLFIADASAGPLVESARSTISGLDIWEIRALGGRRLVTATNAVGGNLLSNFVHFEPGYKLGHPFQEEDQEQMEREM